MNIAKHTCRSSSTALLSSFFLYTRPAESLKAMSLPSPPSPYTHCLLHHGHFLALLFNELFLLHQHLGAGSVVHLLTTGSGHLQASLGHL